MKEFFEALGQLSGHGRSNIIEKDYILHLLLEGLSKSNYLRQNYVFKGGTCLTKAYMGYYRFSEDLDFTWADQSKWEGSTRASTKRMCSEEISRFVEGIKVVSDDLGFRFSGDKDDPKDVHISSGGRIATLSIGYDSTILNMPARLKIEANFVELMLYPVQERTLESFIRSLDSEELEFIFEDTWESYSASFPMLCYDLDEIFAEKCRASMTRRAFKVKDLIDIWLLEDRMDYRIEDHAPAIERKTRFMLDLYKRYRETLEVAQIPRLDLAGTEEYSLLLFEPPEGIAKDIENIRERLNTLRERLFTELKLN